MPKTRAEIGAVGILEREALASLNAAVARVLNLLWDLQPHTSEEIDRAAGSPGKPARRGLARMHELKQAGFEVVRLPEKRNGQFQFKLISRQRQTEQARQLSLIPQTRRISDDY